MFVHTLVLKLQTKNANILEYAFPEYVKNVLLTESGSTQLYTKTWIINFKYKILSISPTKLPAQASAYAEEQKWAYCSFMYLWFGAWLPFHKQCFCEFVKKYKLDVVCHFSLASSFLTHRLLYHNQCDANIWQH